MSVRSGKSDGTVTVTPNGIPVYFQSEPKRLYRIGPKQGYDATEGDLLAQAQNPTPELLDPEERWQEVVSVTTALEVLDKPGLPWWGMKVGAEGVAKLFNLGLAKSLILPGGQQPVVVTLGVIKPDRKKGEKFVPYLSDKWVVAGDEQLVDVLNVQKLTTNHVKNEAGSRGQAVHDAFEHWAKTGELPDPAMYPESEVGYIHGLLEFFKDVPSAEPVGCEIIVASSTHGYAGRYDLRMRTTEPHNVVVHRTPVGGPQYRQLLPGEFLTDLKTSKDVYPSHARQLEGLEQASVESGWEPTDFRGILHVSADGEYKFKKSWATFEDFRVVLDVWKSDQRMKDAERAERKRSE